MNQSTTLVTEEQLKRLFGMTQEQIDNLEDWEEPTFWDKIKMFFTDYKFDYFPNKK